MKMPFTRRHFLKASTLATGAGLAAPLWLSRALAAGASPAVDAKPARFILDMVQYNPGEPIFETPFADPQVIQKMGSNGKVYYMFDAPTLAVDWEAVDPDIFPKGSPGREWVDAKAARIDAEHAACKAAGIKAYANPDLMVLPKSLVEKYGMQTTCRDVQNPQTQKFLRLLIGQVFDRFPNLDGLVMRIGETYLQDAPFHTGGMNNKTNVDNTIIPLIQLLRDEICVKRNKELVFRTWYAFDVNLDTYLKVSAAIEPDPNLVFSVKHCEGDFHRGNPFSKIIGQGRIPQIIEVQCAREYEGKGAYPNYVANGVIEEFEEHRLHPTNSKFHSVGEFARQSPLFAGIWTWSRGGGWQGPSIKNELWCDLNAWVMAQWAHDPQQPEESVFNRYATEKLALDDADVKKFRRLALLSAEAVLRGSVDTMSDISPEWTRDDGIMRPILPADPVKLKRVLDEKDEAVKLWEDILALAKEINFQDAKTKDYAVISAEYGLHLYQIFQAAFHLQAVGVNGDKDDLKTWLAAYDKAWADYRLLPGKSDQCATLYKEGKALKTGREGIDQVVAEFRKAAEAK
jgi:hypothetical protein